MNTKDLAGPALPEELHDEIGAVMVEAESLAPRLAELTSRYQTISGKLGEWEGDLPAETDEQIQARNEATGAGRLDDLMHALACVANVTPHHVEEHEYGYAELERLGVLSGDGPEEEATPGVPEHALPAILGDVFDLREKSLHALWQLDQVELHRDLIDEWLHEPLRAARVNLMEIVGDSWDVESGLTLLGFQLRIRGIFPRCNPGLKL